MMKISVVIIAHSEGETLRESLLSFLNQTLEETEYEVVLVCDGGTKETIAVAKELSGQHRKVSLLTGPNHGPAAARNRGLQQSRNQIVLFSQADVVAEKNLLERHLDFHRHYRCQEEALVGHTTWHPNLKITPFMRWLETGGPQFDFSRAQLSSLSTQSVKWLQTDFLNFYTTNVSLKRAFLNQADGFDEEFKVRSGITAYEDTELGYRLQKLGMVLYYDPEAIAYHKHFKNLDTVLRRRYYEGVMSHKLMQKHPDLTWDRHLPGESVIGRPARMRNLSDKEIFWMSFWLLNPMVMYPFRLLGRYLEDKKTVPILYKFLTRAWYNWGILQGWLRPDTI